MVRDLLKVKTVHSAVRMILMVVVVDVIAAAAAVAVDRLPCGVREKIAAKGRAGSYIGSEIHSHGS